MKIFRYVLFVSIFIVFVNVNAAWLEDIPARITQPDGTVIEVLRSGDEFHNWIHDERGFTIVQDHDTGFWCWAVNEGHRLVPEQISEWQLAGELVSTGYAIHLYEPVLLGISPRENISDERYKEKRDWFMYEIERSGIRSPSVGIINSIVVFIRFQDDTEFGPEALVLDEMFHATGENVNSMYQYFWDASYGKLQVYSPFFPLPNGDLIVSYQSPHLRSYFQPYNAITNTNGYQGGNNGTQRMQREHALLQAAINYIQDQVPTTMVLDSDNDGYVDNVNFMIRGDSGEWADLLWPHRWSLYSLYVYLHGKRVYDYNFNIENFTYVRGVGVLAHEFAHSMSLPDFYRYNNTDITPISRWCLMAQDNEPPQSINGYAKAKYTNWTTSVANIPVITANGTYTLSPLSSHETGHIYRINTPNATNQFYIVEYRYENAAYIDSNLWGSGLLVYRVRNGTNGNSNGPPDEIYVYRPNGTLTVSGDIEQAFYSLQSGRTSINSFTNPMPFLENGQSGGLNIYNIGYAGDTITFSVNMGNLPTPVSPPENLSAEVSWNNVILSWGDAFGMDNGDTSYSSLLTTHSTLSPTPYSLSPTFKVYRDGRLITPTPIADLTFIDQNLPVGTYNYYVTAVVGNNESLPVFVDAEVSIISPDAPPPKNLSYEITDNEIIFTWDEPDEEYLPYYLGVSFFVDEILLNVNPITEYSCAFPLSILPHGMITFSVIALYEYGASEPLVIEIYIEPPLPPLNPPRNLEAEVEGHTVVLSWEAPEEGVTSYKLQVTSNSPHYPPHSLLTAHHLPLTTHSSLSLTYNVYRDGVLLTSTAIIELEFVDEYVLAGTYIYEVTAVYGEEESEPAIIEVISTYEPELYPPQNLEAEVVNENEVYLSWEAPFVGVSSYKLQVTSNSPHSASYTSGADRILSPTPYSLSPVLIGYNVYRDGEYLVTTELLQFYEKHEEYGGCIVGFFEYDITAVYYSELFEEGYLESEPISALVVVGTGLDDKDDLDLPLLTELLGNFPNPFNPETTINFNMAKSGVVLLDIYNIRGQRVKTLLDSFLDAGNHRFVWNGTDDNGSPVSSGMYFYQMRTEEYTAVRRMILMK